MLSEITIKNFAIIEDLALDFAPGFNVLTGETGAGKSIILDAVSLLLGGRADTGVVRSGADTAIIDGVFELPTDDVRGQIEAILTRDQLQGDAPDVLLLAREVKRGGRSVGRVNGHTVNVNVLKEIGEILVDIHGQSEHLSLLKSSSHIDLLDRYGGLADQRASFARLVEQVHQVRSELRDLLTNEQLRKQRAELLAFQVQEITGANLKPSEDEDLRQEAKRLASAEQLTALTTEAYRAIYEASEGSSSANDLIGQAALAVSKLVKYDPMTQEMAELAETLSIQVEELARSLTDYQESIEFDPARLREVETRLDMINNLMRKYHASSIEELLKAGADAAAELETVEHSSERIQELQDGETRLLAEIGREGAVLSRARTEVADRLSKAIEAELGDLRMKEARFGVSIEQVDDPSGAPVGDYRVGFDSTGIDRVEFLIAPNPGEPLHPVARIASGGETSRIMLALKTVLSRADQIPTLIFDEIDAGIGGRTGAIVGQKLWSLSDAHQVLVVTHLPQLAGFADAHFKVEKQASNNRTVTHVARLDAEGQIEELTAMLGAEAESARQSAQELLQYVQQVKQAAPSAG
jgi:DNA repair protein RecN (Recombination protein N)